MFRADLDKRREEKLRLEENRRKENMDKLRREMEKSGGETVVLSTGLKDKVENGDEDDEEMDDEDDDIDLGIYTEDEDAIGEDDEDEEVDKFSF
jgi:hypothetical protein